MRALARRLGLGVAIAAGLLVAAVTLTERPGDPESGHFGLAVESYTHSTAPNRRFPDLVTQRLVKALLAHQAAPYGDDELLEIARRCTQKEDDARKVEREMTKRIAAVAMAVLGHNAFTATLPLSSSAKPNAVRLMLYFAIV